MWGSAFAVCITQSSLTCQFEHSGKVRSGLIGNFYFHCYQVRPHFLCAALMSSQRTKQHAVRRLSIFAPALVVVEHSHVGYSKIGSGAEEHPGWKTGRI